MAVITISKQHYAGGLSLAGRLAKRLGYRRLDREIGSALARDLGLSQGEVDFLDQARHVWTLKLADYIAAKIVRGTSGMKPSDVNIGQIDAEAFFQRTAELITEAADQGNVVIVGRGGALLLWGRPDVIRIRIVAEEETRLTTIMKRDHCDRLAALNQLKRVDQSSADFVRTWFKADWNDPTVNDIVFNRTFLTEEDCLDLIFRAMELKKLI